MKVPGILKNKYVLYVLLVLALVNVLGYLAIQDYNSLALFVVLGLLSSYFSKNMAVNLLIAIVVTSFVIEAILMMASISILFLYSISLVPEA